MRTSFKPMSKGPVSRLLLVAAVGAASVVATANAAASPVAPPVGANAQFATDGLAKVIHDMIGGGTGKRECERTAPSTTAMAAC